MRIGDFTTIAAALSLLFPDFDGWDGFWLISRLEI